ncbi:unnamed protein product [Brugia pahangi]|uniref:Sterile domain-containing protein n=1 Tax=Brugia pahangi TaxID=6280 RepID=A0A0N4TCC4_BRUPA|nr:unnamed protein product [Brugia pahangi]
MESKMKSWMYDSQTVNHKSWMHDAQTFSQFMDVRYSDVFTIHGCVILKSLLTIYGTVLTIHGCMILRPLTQFMDV